MRKIEEKNKKPCKGCKRRGAWRKEFCGTCRALKRKFNAHPADIHNLKVQQGNLCKICGKPPGKRALSVDHKHDADNRIRGLLCTACNVSIGCLPTQELLLAAIEYLKAPTPEVRYFAPIIKTEEERSKRLSEAFRENLAKETFHSERKRAKTLAKRFNVSEEAAMSRLRRIKKEISPQPLDFS